MDRPLVESIPPVGPLELSLRMAAKPAKVTLQPEGQSLPFDYRDGLLRTSVPRVDIHALVVVD